MLQFFGVGSNDKLKLRVSSTLVITSINELVIATISKMDLQNYGVVCVVLGCWLLEWINMSGKLEYWST